MRLDRVYSEGEALVALRKLGFEINDAPLRPGSMSFPIAMSAGRARSPLTNCAASPREHPLSSRC